MSKRKVFSIVLLAFAAALMLACAVFFTACGNNETPGGQNTEQGGTIPGGEEDTPGPTPGGSEEPGTDPDDGKDPGTNPGDDDNPETEEPQDIAVTSVSLNKTSLALEIGDGYTLIATVSPSNATDKTITWSSTNSSVASVSGGKVTAKSEGATTITATAHNGKTALCTVTVSEPAPEVIEVTSVSLDKTSLTLEIGESETLTATVLPGNAADKSVTWTSSAQSVATVANGKITAVGSGTATITATAHNGKTASCTVTVIDPYADFSFTLSGNGYTLTGYSGTDTEVTVPAEYRDKAVTIINGSAFYDCSFIKKITLPDTIKEIGSSAFGYCTSLQTIEIPACTRILGSVFIGCTSLREVTLPDGLISIGNNLFTNCNSLKKVTILSGNVARYTFAYCANLSEIVLGENVSSVAQGAFEDCTSLQYLTLPRVDENTSFNEYYFNLKPQTRTISGSGDSNLEPAEVRSYNIGGHVFALPADGTDWYYSKSSTTVGGVRYQYSGKPVSVTSWENMYEATVGVSWKRPKAWSAEFYIQQDNSLTKLTVTDQLISLYDDVFDGCSCEIDIIAKFPVESVSVVGTTELYLDEFSLEDYILRVKHTDGWIEEFPLAEHLSEVDKQQLQQSGSHTITVTYGGQSCEFKVNLNLRTFDDAVLKDKSFGYDGKPKYLQVTGIPDDTEILWENNGQIEIGEYTVTATLKNPYYEDKTLTAHLYIRQAQYKITYVLGKDDAEAPEQNYYNFGEKFALPSPISVAWEFLGWYADADFTEKVTVIPAEEYGDKVFYAKWQSIFEYANGEITGFTEYGRDQYDSGKLTSINIPSKIDGEKIISVGEEAFRDYNRLTNVAIPNSVTSIGVDAFFHCSSMTNIVIPDSVTSIGSSAFGYCNGLTSVMIGNGVENIGINAFQGCSNLTNVYISDLLSWCKISFADFYANPLCVAQNLYLNGELVTDLVVPEGVTSIRNYAFYSYDGLMSVTISNGVTSIGESAFRECNSLTNVTISDSVTSIGDSAFADCSGLTSVTIGNNVISIGGYAFKNCDKLTSVTIESQVTSIGESAFYGCRRLTSLTVPDSVTSIGRDAFNYCNELTSVYITDLSAWCKISFADSYANPLRVAQNLYLNGKLVTDLVIPNGVTSIGDYSFYSYNGLMSATISNGVTSIGESAFSNCSNITSVTISDSVTSIGSSAFYGCMGLTNITIPDSVTSIGSSAFYNCNKLIEVYNQSTLSLAIGSSNNGYIAYYAKHVYTQINEESWTTDMEVGYRFFYDGNEKVGYLIGYYGTDTTLILPVSFTAYDGTEVKEYEIYQYAFYRNNHLTSVTIPDSVMIIGNHAFSGCSELTSVTIGNHVTDIGERAFDACISLTSVYINDLLSWCKISFADFYANPLYYAHNLYLNGELVTDLVIPNGVTSIGDYSFYSYNGLMSATISNGVTSIGESAFRECNSLTNVTISDSVMSIGSSAFYYCGSLMDITIGSSVESIGSSAFNGCSNLASITIPNGVTNIGSYAFSGCSNLMSITIPDSVMSIGERAFNGCEGLRQIYYNAVYIEDLSSNSNVFWGAGSNSNGITVVFGDSVQSIPANLFNVSNSSYCPNITSITIGNNVKNIGERAFMCCSGLKSVIIPDSVTSIETYAFYDCSGLMSVTIGNGVENIGLGAFRDCGSLTSVTIPNSVTCIGYEAFRDCNKLESVIISDSVTSIDEFAFFGCSSLTSIAIPDGVTSIGLATFGDCKSLTSVMFENSNGWWYSLNETATSGTGISSSLLSNPSTAATYLTSTYCRFYWKRG